MPHGPSLLFDKSSLESLNLDEAVLMDNFYLSTMTPLFYVECLADLEKKIRSNSTPEQLVGSLANRTPDEQAHANVHHMTLLQAELSRQFDLKTVANRVVVSGGRRVQLGDQNGLIFKNSPEEEALNRWRKREFLEVERNTAKAWRRALTKIDFDVMVAAVGREAGPWRKPKTVEDARHIADAMIDNLDPEWLIQFGLGLLGASNRTEEVLNDWRSRRRPPLREDYPYFIHMLRINLFFCLALTQELLRDVKPSHKIDLAYLYYLPFCSVFTSKDNFHVKVAPLFLDSSQVFVNGVELKEDLKKLDAFYSTLPDDVLRTGLINFAAFPPENTEFLVTRLWDKFLPKWRNVKAAAGRERSPEEDKKVLERINQLSRASATTSHDDLTADELDYTLVSRTVRVKKGKWLRFPEEHIQRMREKGELKS